MKLQKLTIKNLASIEDAVIDFENGPLSEESLFLICGVQTRYLILPSGT